MVSLDRMQTIQLIFKVALICSQVCQPVREEANSIMARFIIEKNGLYANKCMAPERYASQQERGRQPCAAPTAD